MWALKVNVRSVFTNDAEIDFEVTMCQCVAYLVGDNEWQFGMRGGEFRAVLFDVPACLANHSKSIASKMCPR